MQICIAGKNQIAVDCLTYLMEEHQDIQLLACTNKSESGIDSWQPSFKLFCEKNQVPVVALETLYDIKDLLFISLEYDRLLKIENFKSGKLFNIHFSRLPAYKGMYTSIWPILNNEKQSGVTLHCIDNGIDTGDIIDQLDFDLKEDFSSRDLYNLYLKYGAELFKKNIETLILNKHTSTQQSIKNSSYYSKRSIDFNNIIIDLNKTSLEIHNQIRAFSFLEYQLPKINGHQIISSEILENKSNGKLGLVYENEFHMIFNTIDYQVKLNKYNL